MATAFIGNLLISNINTVISASTATGQNNGSGGQNLATPISANTTLGSGNYAYQWSQSGTSITFSAATSSSTNVTYSSLSVSGSTTIFCTVRDIWSGVQVVTGTCVITWPVQSITQNIVISGSVTYNGSGQVYTLTPSTGPAPTGSPASFTNAGTYNSTNITLTPSAGYVIGTVTGSFTINKRQLSIPNFDQFDCDGNENGYYNVGIVGIQGSDTVTLEVWIGDINVGPQSVAPVLPFAIGTFNGVTSPGPNPRNITSADVVGGNYYNGGNGLVLKKNDGDTGGSGTTFYWVILYGNATNYISSGYFGPRGNYCGG